MSNGYMSVSLRKEGKQRRYYVHRLVASAFLENPENLREVNHKDENKSNNSIENLEWCTHGYNMKYAGGSARRSAHRKKKVVVIEGESKSVFDSVTSAASYLLVRPTTVSRCCHHVKNTRRVKGREVLFFDEYERLRKERRERMETMTLNEFRKFTRSVKGDTRLVVRMPDGTVAAVCDAYLERRANGSTVCVEVPPTIDGGDE